MKQCPKCTDAPNWHFASNTTRKRADGQSYFLFIGCPHARVISKDWGFVTRSLMPELEAKWNAEAERLFAEVTERWTEPQRTSFALRLGHLSHESDLNVGEEDQAEKPELTGPDAEGFF